MLVLSETKKVDSKESWDTLAERIPDVPASAMIRGMFPRQLVKQLPSASSARYLPFTLYPVREYMELVLRCARALHPRETPANAVLRLGTHVYPLFASSMAGTAIFAVAQIDFRKVCELAPKAYDITLKPGKLACVNSSDTEATLELRQVWPFPDLFHAGIWIGAMDVCGVSGTIQVRRHSSSSVDFNLKWQDTKAVARFPQTQRML
jgi:uncharacterized protein (TIGR02265 family)